jgi:hypothetical protein
VVGPALQLLGRLPAQAGKDVEFPLPASAVLWAGTQACDVSGGQVQDGGIA